MPHPVRGEWKSRPGYSEFGGPRPYNPGTGYKHTGFDYYAPEGTAVFSPGIGTVTFAGYNGQTNGYQVSVALDDGRTTTFSCHLLPEILVRNAQRVTALTKVGEVGHSGNADGIWWDTVWQGGVVRLRHVHHTVRYDGVLVDPIGFYASQAGSGITLVTQQEEDDMAKVAKYYIAADNTGLSVGVGVNDVWVRAAPGEPLRRMTQGQWSTYAPGAVPDVDYFWMPGSWFALAFQEDNIVAGYTQAVHPWMATPSTDAKLSAETLASLAQAAADSLEDDFARVHAAISASPTSYTIEATIRPAAVADEKPAQL